MSGVSNSTFSGAQIDQAVENYLSYKEVHNSAGLLLLPGYLEKRVDISSSQAVNLKLGSVFCLTVSGMTVLSITGTDAITPGYVISVLLVVKMTASSPVVFPASVRWASVAVKTVSLALPTL